MLKHTWTDAEYSVFTNHDKASMHTVVLTFKDEAEAHEFARLIKIEKDVDEELRTYGEGVLRTIARGKKGKRRGKAKR